MNGIDPAKVKWDTPSIDPAAVKWDKPAGPSAAERASVDPTAGNTFGENVLIGVGKAFTDLYRGGRQLASKVGIGDAQAIQAEIDESRKLDAPVMRTAGGVVGNIVGNAAPAVFVPGAGTYLGATTAGLALGAAQPVATDESRLLNTAVGGVGGAAGKLGGDVVGKYVTNRLANAQTAATSAEARNAPRDAALAAAREAGAVVPPRMVQPQGRLGSMLEGISGRTKLEQQASNRNQEVWNTLGRRTLGISDDTPITPEVLQGIRAKAGEAYEALRGAGMITADKQFGTDLAKITQKFEGAAKDFPDLAKNEIGDIVASVNKPSFSADAAIDAISILRDRAAAAYAKGDKGLGSAYRQTSQAMEDAIERNLLERGSAESVKAFQTARRLIAKTYSVENALVGAGDVSAQKLAGQLAKGKPLTDELRTIAEFARSFPKAAQSVAKVEPTSVIDVGTSAILGSLGGLPAAALPLARPLARSAVLSAPYQARTTVPSYAVGRMTELAPVIANNPRLRALLPGLGASTVLNVKNNFSD